MVKRILDTSAYVDIARAPRHPDALWSINTMRHLRRYLSHQRRLTLTGLSVYEILDGLRRSDRLGEIDTFVRHDLSKFEVIYPGEQIMILAAEINARLVLSGLTIGAVGSMIAATAITQRSLLVTSNLRHFERIRDAGFQLEIENWRNE